ncbi:MAG: hypothetical protein ACR2JJ_11845 [Sphingomicrobium sp.]
MTGITDRDGGLEDSALVADLFARSFIETFGHLYARDDLDAFLVSCRTYFRSVRRGDRQS